METATIPSPAESVAAALAAAPEGETNTNPLEHLLKKPDAPAKEPEKAKAEPAKEPAKEPAAPKNLSDSIISDDAPPVETKPVASEEPREGEKPAQFIKRLKQEKADALAKVAQLEQRKPAKEADPEEMAALRKELAEREAILEETAYEKSRGFQDRFAKPIEKAHAAAKDLIAKFTETKGVFERAKALDGKDRLDFLKEHVEDAAGTVFDRMARADELAAEGAAALKDSAERGKTLAAEREAQNGAEVLKAFEAQRESITSKLSVFRGDKADSLFAQAKTLLSGEASGEDVISAAYLAVAAPHYIAELKASRAENATLKARIAEYEGDKPGIQGRGTDSSSDTSKSFIKDGRVRPMSEVLKMQVAG